jgi:2-oxoglutarate dehydrogenase E2 component (dihydrolipoamide succinyltransferase)
MAKFKLLLPKMGESVAEATIIKWNKNPGDHIEADDTVMEIATDKVDSDVPSPVSGTLLEQLCKDNDVVQVGSVIAIIETEEPEEFKEQPIPAPVHRPINEEPPVVEEIPAPVEELYQPVQEMPSQVIEEHILTPEPGEKEVEESKEQVFSEQRVEQTPPVPFIEQLEQPVISKTEDVAKNGLRFYSPLVKNIAAQEGISNAELDQIPGTGTDARLTKDDLLAYIQNKLQSPSQVISTPVTTSPVSEDPVEDLTTKQSSLTKDTEITAQAEELQPPVIEALKPEPVAETSAPKEPIKQTSPESKTTAGTSMSGGDEIIEMDRMRRLIADHMVMSKHTSPHVTSFVEADVTNIVLWREKIKSSFEKREGEKITFTPIFIEAVVRAIKDMPMINVQVNGTQIIKKKDINISMATALPSGNLIVPVIKKADELNLLGITKAVNDLANRARNNKLKPDDVQGGTFTITNVGSFGNVMGTPIINQPQVAILAVGAIKKKPAVIETLQGDMIGIRHMMFLSLSYDHRVVDGALGGSFVRRVADYLENWDPGREI